MSEVVGTDEGAGYGVSGFSSSGDGVIGRSASGDGVSGQSISGYAGCFDGKVRVTGPQGADYAIRGSVPNGIGVLGTEGGDDYVFPHPPCGVFGLGADAPGVIGNSAKFDGVQGSTDAENHSGVWGNNTGSGVGVAGSSQAGYGVQGTSDSSIGVIGISNSHNGVVGSSNSHNAVFGSSNSGNGVYGRSISGYAGYFEGNVNVTGNVNVDGDVNVTGAINKSALGFKLDHPLDPANKYLSHSSVESPDMMDLYNGNITLNANGGAVVEMPSWFQALNRDFRYQLTCIGGAALVYVSEEIQNNQFEIAGGKPGMKVSWQVSGIRQDPYANAHRIPAEQAKSDNERGKYLHPELYGEPETKGINYEKSQPTAPAVEAPHYEYAHVQSIELGEAVSA